MAGIGLGVLMFAGVLYSTGAFAAELFFNSTTACMSGSEQKPYYSAKCDPFNTKETGIIAVHYVHSGAKLEQLQCSPTDPAFKCCQYVKDKDCLITDGSGDIPGNVMSGCSGQRECIVQVKKKFTGKCPLPALFESFTTFSFMEYECVNVGLVIDMCHDGVIQTQKELYIDSNVYHINTEHRDKSCSCSVTTSCGAGILVQAVDIKMKMDSNTRECNEELELSDAREAEFDCESRDLNGFKEIFHSSSNKMEIKLNIKGNHTGRLWMKVKSSWSNATVQIRCGMTSQLDINKDHACPEDLITTTVGTSGAPRSTTQNVSTVNSCDDDPEQKECQVSSSKANEAEAKKLTSPMIGGIIAAGIILLLVIIVVIIFIMKRTPARDDHHIYDIPSLVVPVYETLPYNNVPHQATEKPTMSNGRVSHAYDNCAYQATEGATGNSDYHSVFDPTLDNTMNDSVMVMPTVSETLPEEKMDMK